MLCSDRMFKSFSNFKFESEGVVVPSNSRDTVKFNSLKELLLSKDLSRIDEIQWGSLFESKYLNGFDDTNGFKVALQSFYQGSDRFLTKTLEEITGIVIGSDTDAFASH